MYKIDPAISDVLTDQWMTAGEISNLSGVILQTASRHLGSLYRMGCINRKQVSFIDTCYRRRVRYLYCAKTKTDPFVSPLYARMMGFRKV